MKELVRRIVQSLVDYPEEIEIRETEGTKAKILEIKVSKQDVGKLLGKNGRNINALRDIVSAASKGKKHLVIEVLEEGSLKSKSKLLTGKIKRLLEGKDYGFIESDNGESIFFHASSLKGVKMESLSLNQRVRFELEESPKGLRANKVEPMDNI